MVFFSHSITTCSLLLSGNVLVVIIIVCMQSGRFTNLQKNIDYITNDFRVTATSLKEVG